MILRLLGLVLLMLGAAIGQATAATITATNCTSAAVQTAINAAVNGDLVIVPAGTCTWTTGVMIPSTKGLTLQGAGEAAGGTTIVDNVAGADLLVANIGGANALTRITNFRFDGNNFGKGVLVGIVTVAVGSNALDKFRVDHITIINPGGNSVRGILIWMNGFDVGGLIDHFTCLKATSASVQCVTIDGSSPQSRAAFSRPLSLGTNKAIYIEDSTFTYATENDGALDAYNGARYVFRHNSMTGTSLGHHGADSGDGAGIAGFEVYANTITNPGPGSVSRIGFWRSGVGVVFDNTISGPFSGGISAKTYRSCQSFSFWGQCNGSSPWDENQPGQQGYACVDQVGHQFTQNQGGQNTLAPYYSWNNIHNGTPRNTDIESDCAAANVHLQLNRDIYNSTASFNGTTGTGRGLLAARPATCTPMTAYFATDTNTLYRCTGANTWSSYYTPYTYPHPLQMVAAAGGSEPVCSQPTTIFCEDWETTTLPGRWVDGNQPTISITSTPANVFQGTKAVQATFPPTPASGAGWLGTFLTPTGNAGPSGTPGFDHVYARIYLKLAANWQCEPVVNSCGKIMAFYGAQSGISGPYNPYSGLGQAGVKPNGTDFYYGGTVMTKPTVDREATLYQYFPEMSATFGDNYVGSPTVQIPLNTWVCLEEEFQANTIGGHDGLQRLWVNNALAIEHTGMRWRDTANLQTLMFQLQFSLSPPQQQQYWIDNVVVATQRIGCLAAGPPVPPSDLVTGPAFFLTVSKGGTGTGTVTGPGINCGTVCTHPYTPGDTVTLAATPAGGATFTAWSGACTGSGACTVTMSQARNVTATFSGAATYQLLVSTAADRSNSVELNGFAAPPLGNIYVFTRPTTGVTRVRFFLDDPTMAGAPRTTDTAAEYDFNGTAANGTALPFDTATIATGTHTITAAIDLTAGGTTVLSGSFTVTAGGTVTVAWTDTNTSPNETGTEVYRCVGDRCTPSTAPNNPAATAASNATSATYTENSITSVLGYSLRALGSPANSGFSTPLYVSFHNGTCPCTMFPSTATPAGTSNDGTPLELGVRFKSDTNGFIKGVRFYKGTGETGTHTGSLWTAAGALLATVTFTNETASGWQEMRFATPVAITAGNTYVVSYHTNTGIFASTGLYFTSPFYGPPLHALANGDGGSNGVYLPGAGFPTNTSGSQNYWVDVVFDTVP